MEEKADDTRYDIEEETAALANTLLTSIPLFDRFVNENKSEAAYFLYHFYYRTAKWQRTQQPKATASFAAKGLGWSRRKVVYAKKELVEMGLIAQVSKKDKNGKIYGHYIKVNFIYTEQKRQELAEEINEKHQSAKSDQSAKSCAPPLRKILPTPLRKILRTNALSTNSKNALSTNNIYVHFDENNQNQVQPVNDKPASKTKRKSIKAKQTKLHPADFDKFYDIYPRREAKAKAIQAWAKLCKLAYKDQPTLQQILTALEKRNRQWKQNGTAKQYIPLPASWLNAARWLDEIEEGIQAGNNNTKVSTATSSSAPARINIKTLLKKTATLPNTKGPRNKLRRQWLLEAFEEAKDVLDIDDDEYEPALELAEHIVALYEWYESSRFKPDVDYHLLYHGTEAEQTKHRYRDKLENMIPDAHSIIQDYNKWLLDRKSNWDKFPCTVRHYRYNAKFFKEFLDEHCKKEVGINVFTGKCY